MNFFEQQDRSRRTTRKLVGLYALAVLATAVTLYVGIAAFSAAFFPGEKPVERVALEAPAPDSDGETKPEKKSNPQDFGVAFLEYLSDPGFVTWVLASTFLLIGLSSLYKLARLRAGGSSVALAMGGRKVAPVTRDLRERRLLNVVEEMALAAGISMPSVYVLDNESGMNAFAAGFSSKDAAVTVTRGLLETLNRDEMQAVIGHEFSHILNGDMRLNIRLISVLHGIYALTIIGMMFFWLARVSASASSSTKGGGCAVAIPAFLFGLICWTVGQIGFFFGRMIQCAVSRQREFLADASSVQFTRNPDGLANALKLIGAASSKLDAPTVSAVSHMLFASGMKSIFATHPPLAERIRKVEPAFTGDFSGAQSTLERRAEEAKAEMERLAEEKAARKQRQADVMDAEDERVIRDTMIGVRHALHYEEAAAQPEDTPPPIPEASPAPKPPPLPPDAIRPRMDLSWLSAADRDMLHDPLSAECCVCGALLDTDTRIRDLQLTLLPHRFTNDTEMNYACLAWQARMKDWTVSQRRIACELAVATLHNAAPDNLKAFCASIDKLVRADNVIEPFEFALTCMIRRRLLTGASLANARQSLVAPAALLPEIARVLSMVAAFDAASPQAAQDAWAVGKQRMVPYTGDLVMLEAEAVRDFDALDAALSKLERLPPLFKRELLQACLDIATHDSIITDTEDNFLFAIADAIDAIGWNVAV